METYVTSDAHGHLRALDRVLERVQPGAQDTLYVLGDMVDRGPRPGGRVGSWCARCRIRWCWPATMRR